ncbi:MAG: NAD(P)H-dependent oxidoreductase [Bryobacteraceae bacterium]|nr:NAD(P)H-dependent oxidoreductase [Bryobacteraceae bacterium]
MPQNDESQTVITVLGLPGSVRAGSYTRRAVEVALAGAEAAGARTVLFDPAKHELPFAYDSKAAYNANVISMRKAVRSADGLILGTPEYHGGISGVIKNALDLMGFDEFEGKMIGLVGVSGGAMGAHDALNTLRTIGRALHAWVVPAQAAVPQAWDVFGDDGGMTDPALEARLKGVGQEVARFARLHKCEEAMKFMDAWEKAAPNPGGVRD